MSQKTQGQGQPREVCMVVKRSRERTAGTSRGIDSTKSSSRLSRSGKGHWSRSRVRGRLGLCRSVPSRSCQVTPDHGIGVLEPLEEVEDELLAVAPADEVHLGALELDELGVEA